MRPYLYPTTIQIQTTSVMRATIHPSSLRLNSISVVIIKLNAITFDGNAVKTRECAGGWLNGATKGHQFATLTVVDQFN